MSNKIKKGMDELRLRENSAYVMIDKLLRFLPPEAKYAMQDARGSWFWSSRRPRIKEGDWTPNKHPIQPRRPDGTFECKVLQTRINGNWQDTLQQTIRPMELKRN